MLILNFLTWLICQLNAIFDCVVIKHKYFSSAADLDNEIGTSSPKRFWRRFNGYLSVCRSVVLFLIINLYFLSFALVFIRSPYPADQVFHGYAVEIHDFAISTTDAARDFFVGISDFDYDLYLSLNQDINVISRNFLQSDFVRFFVKFIADICLFSIISFNFFLKQFYIFNYVFGVISFLFGITMPFISSFWHVFIFYILIWYIFFVLYKLRLSPYLLPNFIRCCMVLLTLGFYYRLHKANKNDEIFLDHKDQRRSYYINAKKEKTFSFCVFCNSFGHVHKTDSPDTSCPIYNGYGAHKFVKRGNGYKYKNYYDVNDEIAKVSFCGFPSFSYFLLPFYFTKVHKTAVMKQVLPVKNNICIAVKAIGNVTEKHVSNEHVDIVYFDKTTDIIENTKKNILVVNDYNLAYSLRNYFKKIIVLPGVIPIKEIWDNKNGFDETAVKDVRNAYYIERARLNLIEFETQKMEYEKKNSRLLELKKPLNNLALKRAASMSALVDDSCNENQIYTRRIDLLKKLHNLMRLNKVPNAFANFSGDDYESEDGDESTSVVSISDVSNVSSVYNEQRNVESQKFRSIPLAIKEYHRRLGIKRGFVNHNLNCYINAILHIADRFEFRSSFWINLGRAAKRALTDVVDYRNRVNLDDAPVKANNKYDAVAYGASMLKDATNNTHRIAHFKCNCGAKWFVDLGCIIDSYNPREDIFEQMNLKMTKDMMKCKQCGLDNPNPIFDFNNKAQSIFMLTGKDLKITTIPSAYGLLRPVLSLHHIGGVLGGLGHWYSVGYYYGDRKTYAYKHNDSLPPERLFTIPPTNCIFYELVHNYAVVSDDLADYKSVEDKTKLAEYSCKFNKNFLKRLINNADNVEMSVNDTFDAANACFKPPCRILRDEDQRRIKATEMSEDYNKFYQSLMPSNTGYHKNPAEELVDTSTIVDSSYNDDDFVLEGSYHDYINDYPLLITDNEKLLALSAFTDINHRYHNKHHYQYWVPYFWRKPTNKVVEEASVSMPISYRRNLLMDHLSDYAVRRRAEGFADYDISNALYEYNIYKGVEYPLLKDIIQYLPFEAKKYSGQLPGLSMPHFPSERKLFEDFLFSYFILGCRDKDFLSAAFSKFKCLSTATYYLRNKIKIYNSFLKLAYGFCDKMYDDDYCYHAQFFAYVYKQHFGQVALDITNISLNNELYNYLGVMPKFKNPRSYVSVKKSDLSKYNKDKALYGVAIKENSCRSYSPVVFPNIFQMKGDYANHSFNELVGIELALALKKDLSNIVDITLVLKSFDKYVENVFNFDFKDFDELSDYASSVSETKSIEGNALKKQTDAVVPDPNTLPSDYSDEEVTENGLYVSDDSVEASISGESSSSESDPEEDISANVSALMAAGRNNASQLNDDGSVATVPEIVITAAEEDDVIEDVIMEDKNESDKASDENINFAFNMKPNRNDEQTEPIIASLPIVQRAIQSTSGVFKFSATNTSDFVFSKKPALNFNYTPLVVNADNCTKTAATSVIAANVATAIPESNLSELQKAFLNARVIVTNALGVSQPQNTATSPSVLDNKIEAIVKPIVVDSKKATKIAKSAADKEALFDRLYENLLKRKKSLPPRVYERMYNELLTVFDDDDETMDTEENVTVQPSSAVNVTNVEVVTSVINSVSAVNSFVNNASSSCSSSGLYSPFSSFNYASAGLSSDTPALYKETPRTSEFTNIYRNVGGTVNTCTSSITSYATTSDSDPFRYRVSNSSAPEKVTCMISVDSDTDDACAPTLSSMPISEIDARVLDEVREDLDEIIAAVVDNEGIDYIMEDVDNMVDDVEPEDSINSESNDVSECGESLEGDSNMEYDVSTADNESVEEFVTKVDNNIVQTDNALMSTSNLRLLAKITCNKNHINYPVTKAIQTESNDDDFIPPIELDNANKVSAIVEPFISTSSLRLLAKIACRKNNINYPVDKAMQTDSNDADFIPPIDLVPAKPSNGDDGNGPSSPEKSKPKTPRPPPPKRPLPPAKPESDGSGSESSNGSKKPYKPRNSSDMPGNVNSIPELNEKTGQYVVDPRCVPVSALYVPPIAGIPVGDYTSITEKCFHDKVKKGNLNYVASLALTNIAASLPEPRNKPNPRTEWLYTNAKFYAYKKGIVKRIIDPDGKWCTVFSDFLKLALPPHLRDYNFNSVLVVGYDGSEKCQVLNFHKDDEPIHDSSVVFSVSIGADAKLYIQSERKNDFKGLPFINIESYSWYSMENQESYYHAVENTGRRLVFTFRIFKASNIVSDVPFNGPSTFIRESDFSMPLALYTPLKFNLKLGSLHVNPHFVRYCPKFRTFFSYNDPSYYKNDRINFGLAVTKFFKNPQVALKYSVNAIVQKALTPNFTLMPFSSEIKNNELIALITESSNFDPLYHVSKTKTQDPVCSYKSYEIFKIFKGDLFRADKTKSFTIERFIEFTLVWLGTKLSCSYKYSDVIERLSNLSITDEYSFFYVNHLVDIYNKIYKFPHIYPSNVPVIVGSDYEPLMYQVYNYDKDYSLHCMALSGVKEFKIGTLVSGKMVAKTYNIVKTDISKNINMRNYSNAPKVLKPILKKTSDKPSSSVDTEISKPAAKPILSKAGNSAIRPPVAKAKLVSASEKSVIKSAVSTSVTMNNLSVSDAKSVKVSAVSSSVATVKSPLHVNNVDKNITIDNGAEKILKNSSDVVIDMRSVVAQDPNNEDPECIVVDVAVDSKNSGIVTKTEVPVKISKLSVKTSNFESPKEQRSCFVKFIETKDGGAYSGIPITGEETRAIEIFPTSGEFGTSTIEEKKYEVVKVDTTEKTSDINVASNLKPEELAENAKENIIPSVNPIFGAENDSSLRDLITKDPPNFGLTREDPKLKSLYDFVARVFYIMRNTPEFWANNVGYYEIATNPVKFWYTVLRATGSDYKKFVNWIIYCYNYTRYRSSFLYGAGDAYQLGVFVGITKSFNIKIFRASKVEATINLDYKPASRNAPYVSHYVRKQYDTIYCLAANIVERCAKNGSELTENDYIHFKKVLGNKRFSPKIINSWLRLYKKYYNVPGNSAENTFFDFMSSGDRREFERKAMEKSLKSLPVDGNCCLHEGDVHYSFTGVPINSHSDCDSRFKRLQSGNVTEDFFVPGLRQNQKGPYVTYDVFFCHMWQLANAGKLSANAIECFVNDYVQQFGVKYYGDTEALIDAERDEMQSSIEALSSSKNAFNGFWPDDLSERLMFKFVNLGIWDNAWPLNIDPDIVGVILNKKPELYLEFCTEFGENVEAGASYGEDSSYIDSVINTRVDFKNIEVPAAGVLVASLLPMCNAASTEAVAIDYVLFNFTYALYLFLFICYLALLYLYFKYVFGNFKIELILFIFFSFCYFCCIFYGSFNDYVNGVVHGYDVYSHQEKVFMDNNYGLLKYDAIVSCVDDYFSVMQSYCIDCNRLSSAVSYEFIHRYAEYTYGVSSDIKFIYSSKPCIIVNVPPTVPLRAAYVFLEDIYSRIYYNNYSSSLDSRLDLFYESAYRSNYSVARFNYVLRQKSYNYDYISVSNFYSLCNSLPNDSKLIVITDNSPDTSYFANYFHSKNSMFEASRPTGKLQPKIFGFDTLNSSNVKIIRDSLVVDAYLPYFEANYHLSSHLGYILESCNNGNKFSCDFYRYYVFPTSEDTISNIYSSGVLSFFKLTLSNIVSSEKTLYNFDLSLHDFEILLDIYIKLNFNVNLIDYTDNYYVYDISYFHENVSYSFSVNKLFNNYFLGYHTIVSHGFLNYVSSVFGYHLTPNSFVGDHWFYSNTSRYNPRMPHTADYYSPKLMFGGNCNFDSKLNCPFITFNQAEFDQYLERYDLDGKFKSGVSSNFSIKFGNKAHKALGGNSNDYCLVENTYYFCFKGVIYLKRNDYLSIDIYLNIYEDLLVNFKFDKEYVYNNLFNPYLRVYSNQPVHLQEFIEKYNLPWIYSSDYFTINSIYFESHKYCDPNNFNYYGDYISDYCSFGGEISFRFRKLNNEFIDYVFVNESLPSDLYYGVSVNIRHLDRVHNVNFNLDFSSLWRYFGVTVCYSRYFGESYFCFEPQIESREVVEYNVFGYDVKINEHNEMMVFTQNYFAFLFLHALFTLTSYHILSFVFLCVVTFIVLYFLSSIISKRTATTFYSDYTFSLILFFYVQFVRVVCLFFEQPILLYYYYVILSACLCYSLYFIYCLYRAFRKDRSERRIVNMTLDICFLLLFFVFYSSWFFSIVFIVITVYIFTYALNYSRIPWNSDCVIGYKEASKYLKLYAPDSNPELNPHEREVNNIRANLNNTSAADVTKITNLLDNLAKHSFLSNCCKLLNSNFNVEKISYWPPCLNSKNQSIPEASSTNNMSGRNYLEAISRKAQNYKFGIDRAFCRRIVKVCYDDLFDNVSLYGWHEPSEGRVYVLRHIIPCNISISARHEYLAKNFANIHMYDVDGVQIPTVRVSGSIFGYSNDPNKAFIYFNVEKDVTASKYDVDMQDTSGVCALVHYDGSLDYTFYDGQYHTANTLNGYCGLPLVKIVANKVVIIGYHSFSSVTTFARKGCFLAGVTQITYNVMVKPDFDVGILCNDYDIGSDAGSSFICRDFPVYSFLNMVVVSWLNYCNKPFPIKLASNKVNDITLDAFNLTVESLESIKKEFYKITGDDVFIDYFLSSYQNGTCDLVTYRYAIDFVDGLYASTYPLDIGHMVSNLRMPFKYQIADDSKPASMVNSATANGFNDLFSFYGFFETFIFLLSRLHYIYTFYGVFPGRILNPFIFLFSLVIDKFYFRSIRSLWLQLYTFLFICYFKHIVSVLGYCYTYLDDYYDLRDFFGAYYLNLDDIYSFYLEYPSLCTLLFMLFYILFSGPNNWRCSIVLLFVAYVSNYLILFNNIIIDEVVWYTIAAIFVYGYPRGVLFYRALTDFVGYPILRASDRCKLESASDAKPSELDYKAKNFVARLIIYLQVMAYFIKDKAEIQELITRLQHDHEVMTYEKFVLYCKEIHTFLDSKLPNIANVGIKCTALSNEDAFDYISTTYNLESDSNSKYNALQLITDFQKKYNMDSTVSNFMTPYLILNLISKVGLVDMTSRDRERFRSFIVALFNDMAFYFKSQNLFRKMLVGVDGEFDTDLRNRILSDVRFGNNVLADIYRCRLQLLQNVGQECDFYEVLPAINFLYNLYNERVIDKETIPLLTERLEDGLKRVNKYNVESKLLDPIINKLNINPTVENIPKSLLDDVNYTNASLEANSEIVNNERYRAIETKINDILVEIDKAINAEVKDNKLIKALRYEEAELRRNLKAVRKELAADLLRIGEQLRIQNSNLKEQNRLNQLRVDEEMNQKKRQKMLIWMIQKISEMDRIVRCIHYLGGDSIADIWLRIKDNVPIDASLYEFLTKKPAIDSVEKVYYIDGDIDIDNLKLEVCFQIVGKQNFVIQHVRVKSNHITEPNIRAGYIVKEYGSYTAPDIIWSAYKNKIVINHMVLVSPSSPVAGIIFDGDISESKTGDSMILESSIISKFKNIFYSSFVCFSKQSNKCALENLNMLASIPTRCGLELSCDRTHRHSSLSCYSSLRTAYYNHVDSCVDCLKLSPFKKHTRCALATPYDQTSFEHIVSQLVSCDNCRLCMICGGQPRNPNGNKCNNKAWHGYKCLKGLNCDMTICNYDHTDDFYVESFQPIANITEIDYEVLDTKTIVVKNRSKVLMIVSRDEVSLDPSLKIGLSKIDDPVYTSRLHVYVNPAFLCTSNFKIAFDICKNKIMCDKIIESAKSTRCIVPPLDVKTDDDAIVYHLRNRCYYLLDLCLSLSQVFFMSNFGAIPIFACKIIFADHLARSGYTMIKDYFGNTANDYKNIKKLESDNSCPTVSIIKGDEVNIDKTQILHILDNPNSYSKEFNIFSHCMDDRPEHVKFCALHSDKVYAVHKSIAIDKAVLYLNYLNYKPKHKPSCKNCGSYILRSIVNDFECVICGNTHFDKVNETVNELESYVSYDDPTSKNLWDRSQPVYLC